MEKLKNKKLALFLDRFGTLEALNRHGILDREAALYNLLAADFEKIFVFTYGDKRELEYGNRFKGNIEIICRPAAIPRVIYELIIPFVHLGIIKSAAIFKSNQNIGSLAPTIAKILHPRARLVIRGGYIGSETARRSGFPWYAKAYFRFVQWISYRLCDHAFMACEENCKTLMLKYPFLKKKLTALNNYVDTEVFKKTPGDKKYDIIYVARLHKGKNHAGLLEAVKGLGLKLLFIGRGNNKEALLVLAKRYSIDLTAIDTIPHDKLPGYYNASRICVFPSLHEGNPKALLEAMSMEIPVLGLDVPGVRDVVLHGINGLLSQPTPHTMRLAILELLDNPDLQDKISRAGRQFILENYSLQKLYRLERSLYEKFNK